MNRCSLLSLAFLGAAALALPASAGVPVGAGADANFGPFTIKVEIEGVTQGVFESVEGLGSQSEVIIQDESGSTAEAPGPLKGSRLILKRPYDPLLNGLWNWRQSVIDRDPRKRDGSIFIFDRKGQLVAHWIFHKGWPCRWEVPALTAGATEPAVEIVEIVHAGLSLESSSGS
jgi:phage tail-like protein